MHTTPHHPYTQQSFQKARATTKCWKPNSHCIPKVSLAPTRQRVSNHSCPVLSCPAAEEDERLAEAKRREEIHRRNLEQYRAAVSRLYEEQPHSYTDMPGFTPGELAERERIIVEEMVRINYSKRYQDNKHEYRYQA